MAFSSRHECFTSDSGLTRTRLVLCVFLTSLKLVLEEEKEEEEDETAVFSAVDDSFCIVLSICFAFFVLVVRFLFRLI